MPCVSINSDISADSSSRPRKITARVLAGLNIAQIGALLAKAPTVERRLCALLEKDRRAGVRRLAVRERTRQRLREAEEAREARMRELESRLWDSGLTRVAGEGMSGGAGSGRGRSPEAGDGLPGDR